MKKILTVLLISIFSLFLVSCGKTKFEDLPKEKQEQIQTEVKAIIAPKMKEAMQIAFNFQMKDEEKEKKIEEITKGLKEEVENYLNNRYPDIEFNYDEITKVDNSRQESEKKEVKKEYKQIKLGDFATMTGTNNEGKLKIKVSDIVWKGKEFTDGYMKYTAKNEWLAIKLESENIGKKPAFKLLSLGTKLITKDGVEYQPADSLQISETRDGYGGCIECGNNPGDKAEQYILFDIKKIDLAGAKLRFEDDLIDFEL